MKSQRTARFDNSLASLAKPPTRKFSTKPSKKKDTQTICSPKSRIASILTPKKLHSALAASSWCEAAPCNWKNYKNSHIVAVVVSDSAMLGFGLEQPQSNKHLLADLTRACHEATCPAYY